MELSKVSIGGGGFPSSHKDARDDLGYGRLHPKYHVPKTLGNDSYPYRDKDEDVSDVDTGLEEEEEQKLWDLINSPQDYDPGGGHYDPFSFVGGNTPLAGPAHIGERFSPSPSMVPPISREFKKTSSSPAGGTKIGTARGDGSTMAPTLDTGDRWGWSNPPLHNLFDEESEEEYNYTSEDITDSNESLRECIRMLIMELT